MSFVQRLLSISVQLAPNTQTNQPNQFLESGTDVVILSGSRTSVKIENSGSAANSRATIKIWGMTPSLMNQLSTLGLVVNLVPKNQITVQAGDDVSGMATVFTGTIWNSYGDYEAMPDVPFIFTCLQSGADVVISAPPSSFRGAADVATMMSGFARQINMGFENNGVSSTLYNQYFSGSVRTQINKCAKAANINVGVVNGNTLAIWPKGGNRNTSNVPVISSQTGMVGYPAFTQQGIIVKTLFSPLIAVGGLFQIESSLLSGISAVQQQLQSGGSPIPKSSLFPSQWAVNKLDLDLESLLPKGQWLSTIYGYNPGYPRPLIT